MCVYYIVLLNQAQVVQDPFYNLTQTYKLITVNLLQPGHAMV